MSSLNSVLCAVDLSELSIPALAWADAVSQWYRSELRVLHVVPSFEPTALPSGALFEPVQFLYPMTEEQIQERLRDAMRMSGVSADRATAVAKAGNPVDVIVDQAQAIGADLVVMATHGRSGWNRVMLGSVTEKVLRRVQCPVLTVPPLAGTSAMAATPAPARPALKAVLCPVDFSAASLDAMEFAIDVAHRAGASVTFLHVVEWLAEQDAREFAHFAVPEFPRVLIQDARAELESLVETQRRAGQRVTVEVAAGRAHRHIAAVATGMKADLIVLGAHGRGGPPIAALGSTVEQVVRSAPCPVLTVRAPQEGS
jgi:nucleotide-binding universal stress UspA family protein